MKYKIGDKLICLDNRFMFDTGIKTYSKGKQYKIIKINYNYIVPDDSDIFHELTEDYIDKYFIIDKQREVKLKRILK